MMVYGGKASISNRPNLLFYNTIGRDKASNKNKLSYPLPRNNLLVP